LEGEVGVSLARSGSVDGGYDSAKRCISQKGVGDLAEALLAPSQPPGVQRVAWRPERRQPGAQTIDRDRRELWHGDLCRRSQIGYKRRLTAGQRDGYGGARLRRGGIGSEQRGRLDHLVEVVHTDDAVPGEEGVVHI